MLALSNDCGVSLTVAPTSWRFLMRLPIIILLNDQAWVCIPVCVCVCVLTVYGFAFIAHWQLVVRLIRLQFTIYSIGAAYYFSIRVTGELRPSPLA